MNLAPSSPPEDAAEPSPPSLTHGQLFLRFLRFGFMAWGGPVAQIAMLRRELVDEERWISSARFNRLLAVMQAQGSEEEQAALTLGAGGWPMFWRVVLPKIKWGLVYGVILCNARAMGEFGAVSVVSGHIRGVTNTMPLHVEILYNEYQRTAAFAVASLLALLALATLVLKQLVGWRMRGSAAA